MLICGWRQGEFGCGNIDEGYDALEKAVDLYIEIHKLPDGAELSYNCPALDVLTNTIVKAVDYQTQRALLYLTVTNGWEWFNGVREQDRYQQQIERLKMYYNE